MKILKNNENTHFEEMGNHKYKGTILENKVGIRYLDT